MRETTPDPNIGNPSLLDRVALQACPAALALGMAFLIGLAYALAVFGPAYLQGSSPAWLLPNGLIGGTPDMAMSMSGYFWFVQDAWRWPLFQIAQANGAAGVNAALTDPVADIALPAKLWRTMTGSVVNLFPVWIVGGFGLSSAALAALVRALNQRTLLAAVVAGCMGALAPVVHYRYGHLGLAGHWIVVFALAAYAAAGRRGPRATGATLLLLCLLGFGASLYLWLMVAAITAAFYLHAGTDRAIGPVAAAMGVAATLATGVGSLWVVGLLGTSSLQDVTVPFGVASMNLLAPFWPQSSGAFGWTGVYALTRGSIGGTRGQYEGYCYLGLGALLLVGIALARRGGRLPGLVRRHWALTLALLTLTLWAVSNHIYLGSVLIASIPLPDVLLDTVLAWFRGSGRLFWPVAWLILALGVVGSLSALRPPTALLVAVVAVALQWIDSSVLRARLEAAAATPHASAFGSPAEAAAVYAEIALRGRVAVAPSINCTAQGPGDYAAPETLAAIEVQLAAARANAAMPAIATGRGGTDCAAERATPVATLAGGGVLVALAQPPDRDRTAEARAALDCRPFPVGWVCRPR